MQTISDVREYRTPKTEITIQLICAANEQFLQDGRKRALWVRIERQIISRHRHRLLLLLLLLLQDLILSTGVWQNDRSLITHQQPCMAECSIADSCSTCRRQMQ